MPGWEVVGEEEAAMVQSVFASGGVLMAHGFTAQRTRFFVREFEGQCREFFESPHCLAVSSGTAATKIALQCLGVGPQHEVITQAFNFISTVEAIREVGATPVIVDCDEGLHIDVDRIADLISSKTRAIVVAHMLGSPGPMNDLRALCSERGVFLVEDACESVGARFGGKYAGTLSDVGVFSFDHGKMVTTGEGGLVLTSRPEIAELAISLHDHGHAYDPGVPRNLDTQRVAGFNFRMSELEAAVGLAQLTKLPDMLRANHERAAGLKAGLKGSFRIRPEFAEAESTGDTIVLVGLEPNEISHVVEVLAKFGLGTKNVPDALRWHFAGHWDCLLDQDSRDRLKTTANFLASSVAIPVLLSKSVDFYFQLGQSLANGGLDQ